MYSTQKRKKLSRTTVVFLVSLKLSNKRIPWAVHGADGSWRKNGYFVDLGSAWGPYVMPFTLSFNVA